MKYLIFLFIIPLYSQNIMVTEIAKKKASAAGGVTFVSIDTSSHVSEVPTSFTEAATLTGATNQYCIVAIGSHFPWTAIDSVVVNGANGGKMTFFAFDGVNVEQADRTGLYLYGLKNVESGSRTFTFYMHSDASFSGNIIIAEFGGVNQTVSIGDTASFHTTYGYIAPPTSMTITTTITNTPPDMLVDFYGLYREQGGATLTPLTGQTLYHGGYYRQGAMGIQSASASSASASYTQTSGFPRNYGISVILKGN